MHTHRVTSFTALAVLTAIGVFGCSQYKKGGGDTSEEERREQQARQTMQTFRNADPSMQEFFDNAFGYAVFPKIAKGGVGIGGAHGHGVVYQQGQIIGYTQMSQGTLGFQLGGQTYREIIFFENEAALEEFKGGEMEFAAQASAVAADEGAARNADFDNGVAVFTIPRGGLMFEASIGGQKFSYQPKIVDGRVVEVERRVERERKTTTTTTERETDVDVDDMD